MDTHIAIIGAGMAGLAAACSLQGRAAVTLIEKSRGVSGRAATRTHPRQRTRDAARSPHTAVYDHGANHFTLRPPEVDRLVRSLDLVPKRIDAPVWTLASDGTLAPGDPGRDDAAKFTLPDGIRTLGKALAERAGAQVLTETRVVGLDRDSTGRWMLQTGTSSALGPFDAVLLTPPGPQAAEIAAATTGVDAAIHAEWQRGLGTARYRSQFSVALGYAERLAFETPFYALINPDGEHPIAWLTVEDRKPEHVPDGQSVLVAQLSAAWTEGHYDDPREDVATAVGALVADALRPALVGAMPPVAWWGAQRWRYALPDAGYDTTALASAEGQGLFVAGDSVAGRGRVDLALASGLDAGERIAEYLDKAI